MVGGKTATNKIIGNLKLKIALTARIKQRK
jgi:hypothetical protein